MMTSHVVGQHGPDVTRPGDAVVVNAYSNLLNRPEPVSSPHDFTDGLVQVASELIGRGTDSDDIGKFAGILRHVESVDRRGPATWFENAAEHPDHGGFSAAHAAER